MANQSGMFKIPIQKSRNSIPIDNFILGGIGDSPYSGQKYSLASMVGFDLHSVPGLVKVAQKLSLDSGTTITDLVKILSCSDGNIYFFGRSQGTVWKRDINGTYSVLGVVSPSGGSAGILDAIEFSGKIYYAMQNRLGQWDFTQSFGNRNDNYANFIVGNSTNHPMIIVNEVLYIGDSNNVAQTDGNAFTGNALVLKAPRIISSLGKQVTDLLIGTTIPNYIPYAHVFRWNTWSISYTNDYEVPESGVNMFLPINDSVIIQAGINGNFYELINDVFQLKRQIPANFPTAYTPVNTGIVDYPAVAVFQGIPIFGFSNINGNPAYQGVYAYGARADNYPKILTLPFPISTNNLSNIVIWSIAVVGNEIFVSWKDTNNNTTTYGVDILDWNNKYNGAFFETRLIKYSRIFMDIYRDVVINYQSLPANTAINLFYDENWQGYIQFTGSDIVTDTKRNFIETILEPRAKTMRFKVQTTANGNNAPTIEDMIIVPE